MPAMIRLKRRPLWTALGLCCSALGCFLMAVPHLMAGDYKESSAGFFNQKLAATQMAGKAGKCFEFMFEFYVNLWLSYVISFSHS